jgi:hypothetical protein
MEGIRLIAARRFLLPGGGETVPGEEVPVERLGTEAAANRLLRVGHLFGYDDAGKPVRQSRDFLLAKRLAPPPLDRGGAAAAAREPEPRPLDGRAEPSATAAGESAVAPAPELEKKPKPKSAGPGGKRRRKRTAEE